MSAAAHIDPSNKKIALLIAVLALVLAFSETLGKSAQTAALNLNTEASNLWAFFQAKTIRLTTVHTAAEMFEIEAPGQPNPQVREAMEKKAADWKKTAARYDSEPETQAKWFAGEFTCVVSLHPPHSEFSRLRARYLGRDRELYCSLMIQKSR